MIRLDPCHAVAYEARAEVYDAVRRYDRAILDYDDAICRDPRDGSAYLGRGMTTVRQGKGVGAEKDLKNACEADPGQEVMYRAWEGPRQTRGSRKAVMRSAAAEPSVTLSR